MTEKQHNKFDKPSRTDYIINTTNKLGEQMQYFTTLQFIEQSNILGPVDMNGNYSDRLEGAESTLFAVSADFNGELDLDDAVWLIAHHFGVTESDLLKLHKELANGQNLSV
jgi:hypothetical protein